MAKSKKSVEVDRKKQFLDIGAKLAAKYGAKNVTRRMVAKEAGVTSDALVSHHLGGTEVAQKKYAAHAKKLGLTLPSKAEVEAAGVALRKKPRTKVTPKKSVARAPAKKAGARAVAKKAASPKRGNAKSQSSRATAASGGDAKKSSRASRAAETAPSAGAAAKARKTAARAPKAPPPAPPPAAVDEPSAPPPPPPPVV
jgi:DnaK suppressor protein